MRPRGIIALVLGVVLTVSSVSGISRGGINGIIPLIIGLSLIYLGWRGGRVPLIVFGHACIVVGAILVTLGIYLLPHSQPTMVHVFTRPLFWGIFSIGGGVCALFHAFCNCVRRQTQPKA